MLKMQKQIDDLSTERQKLLDKNIVLKDELNTCQQKIEEHKRIESALREEIENVQN